MTDPITKSEVIAELAARLRDESISDEVFVKLMTAMCRLQGWI
jgi:hypothetical protein